MHRWPIQLSTLDNLLSARIEIGARFSASFSFSAFGRYLLLFALLITELLLFGPIAAAWADSDATTENVTSPLPEHQPRVCTGYSNEYQTWNILLHCGANEAYFATTQPAGASTPTKASRFLGFCCPLPANDILLESHTWEIERCPSDSIATGVKQGECSEILSIGFCSSDEISLMRCSKINTARYQLGEKFKGKYWGAGSAAWREKSRMRWKELPAGIRYGVGRSAKMMWASGGCISNTPGTLLTARKGKRCAGFEYRQLEFLGVAGDPHQGTPVKMFPDCTNVDNPMKPQTKCVTGNTPRHNEDS